MPLSSYPEMLASVAAWLDRDDLAAIIPDLIPMAESRLNDRLRLAPMEKTATLTPAGLTVTGDGILTNEETGEILSSEVTGALLTSEDGAIGITGTVIGGVQLPDDFLEIRMLLANTSPRGVLKLAAPNLAAYLYDGIAGWPGVYTIIGTTLAIFPTYDVSLALTYYAKIPPLTDAAPTNWLLARYPQMYLYASLLEAAPVLQDDARVVLWKAALDEAITDAQKSDLGSRWSNAGLTLRGPTP